MEDHLQDIVAGRAAHTLTITYSDVHGLWGGVAVTLTTHGAYERLEYLRGASAPDVIRGMLAPARIQEVVRLLLEVKAWEQRTPDRAPVPDESRATLMLRVGEAASSTWEWYNDLTQNARLIRMRDLLVALAADLAEP